MRPITIVLILVCLAGCAPRSAHDNKYVSKSIADRTGHSIDLNSKPGQMHFPQDVTLEDGLTEDEAIAVALWNNAQFQADLMELGFARADLVDAGLLKNPMLSLLFPVGPKQLEFTLNFAIDALWQRPTRVAAAKLDVERVAENLVQHGLNLARDVVIGYSGLALAQERQRLASENARVQQEIANITAARLRLGDISELEGSISHLEALRAQDASVRRTQEADIARARFVSLLGLGEEDRKFMLTPSPPMDLPLETLPELLKASYSSRPDLRAAELAIEAAGKRIGWEKSRIFSFTALLDANAQGKEGFEMGPGILAELPILSQNNGKIARARVQMEQSVRQYFAVKQQIALEVKEAHTNYLAAQQSLELARAQWVPAATEAASNAEKAYAGGEVSYLYVLQINSQLLEARLRETESLADLHRAIANVKYSIGFYQTRQPDDQKAKPQ